jgi:Zn-dependent protease/CBS domain-containing protein
MSNPSYWSAGHEEFHASPSRRRFAHRNSQVTPAAQQEGTPNDNTRMAWSWRLGRFAGIDVYIHATFLILIGWLLLVHFSSGSSAAETVRGLLFVFALFSCVVLHEYGHALTARRYGVQTRDITLLPIGGVARLERIPREPVQELLVALAGPAVNVAIALLLFGAQALLGYEYRGFEGGLLGTGANPLGDLMHINLVLAVFNLLPAFPMDGGRVLRALLAMKVSRVNATKVAAILGQIMAVGFAILGLMGNPFLLFIALFIYMGAAQEYQTTRWESAVEGLVARDAMLTQFRTLVANDPLSRAVSLLLHGSQHDFPVLDDNFRVVGLLLRQDLISALSQAGSTELPVSKAMRTQFESASPDEALETVFQRMQDAQLPVLPVFNQDGKLVGLITMENVAEVVMVKNALEKARKQYPRPNREIAEARPPEGERGTA